MKAKRRTKTAPLQVHRPASEQNARAAGAGAGSMAGGEPDPPAQGAAHPAAPSARSAPPSGPAKPVKPRRGKGGRPTHPEPAPAPAAHLAAEGPGRDHRAHLSDAPAPPGPAEPAPAPSSTAGEPPAAVEPRRAVESTPPEPQPPGQSSKAAEPPAPPGPDEALGPPAAPKGPWPDFDRLAQNMALLVEESGKAATAYLKPRAAAPAPPALGDDVKDMVGTFGRVASHWLTDPAQAIKAQADLSTRFVDLWAKSLLRFTGGAPPPEPAGPVDRRFAAPEWRDVPAFDFVRQAYLLTTDWANSLVEEADSLDPETRDRARFYLRQVSSALSPSNFLATNPELLRETLEQEGGNLVRGMRMLAEDIEAGKGDLKIRQSDPTPFELGVNMAVSPGKVILRNDLMELIQYAPSTPEVYRRPLLIVPPWINKFYVLDLNPEKSFIRWAVAQGLTVFVVSWVNPDERHADKGFEAYMREGVLTALDAIEAATGERDATAIGYCVGGTLLAVTLALMAARGDARISSATFFAAQTDFQDAGDLKVFASEDQIAALEAEMKQTGYLQGSKMANAFNMLRPNELIWSYVVNTYGKGQAPAAFDLLAWNADSTRMPAANHSFYLRNCYLGNKLTKGEMVLCGERLDLGKVKVPVYNLATREDHIAPARSVFTGAKFFGGPMRYVLAGSGHIAGVINPPSRAKYQYWEGPPVAGSFEDWLAAATEHKGTWWPDWITWIAAQAPDMVPARTPGAGRLAALCDAPGEYVRVPS